MLASMSRTSPNILALTDFTFIFSSMNQFFDQMFKKFDFAIAAYRNKVPNKELPHLLKKIAKRHGILTDFVESEYVQKFQ